MARIKLNLARLSAAEKTAKARQLVTSITGNPDFPTPTPSLASITTAATDLENAIAAAQAARQDAKTKTTDQNDKESFLDRLLTQLAAYVESVASDIDLSWDTTFGAKSYVIERSADPPTPTSWAHAAVSTKSKATITTLASGTRHWFRVAAVGTNGQSGWSDPGTKIAP
jgi:hypothetical protein